MTQLSKTSSSSKDCRLDGQVGFYQGVIAAIWLPIGYSDINIATAYGLLISGSHLVI
jgi:hypothetical protein